MENKTILLIENNPDDQALLLRALQKNNISSQIVIKDHGPAALQYLQETLETADSPPDLILLDLKLPRMSGFEILQRIRAQQITRFVPIVILTSSNDPQDISRSYHLGASSYMCKPIDLNEFDELVKSLVRHWLIFNLLPLPSSFNREIL
jgi:two-component system, response regulator